MAFAPEETATSILSQAPVSEDAAASKSQILSPDD